LLRFIAAKAFGCLEGHPSVAEPKPRLLSVLGPRRPVSMYKGIVELEPAKAKLKVSLLVEARILTASTQGLLPRLTLAFAT
jgi:hypothetical protein